MINNTNSQSNREEDPATSGLSLDGRVDGNSCKGNNPAEGAEVYPPGFPNKELIQARIVIKDDDFNALFDQAATDIKK